MGPIRNKIRDDLKAQLDRTLGPTLRGFLKGYTTIAITNAAGFVLSEQNRRAFGSANARLLQSILDRPLDDLLPESSNPSIVKLRTEFFGYLRDLGREDSLDLEKYATFVYDIVGDKSLDSLGLNVHRVLDASPTLESTANRLLDEVIENPELVQVPGCGHFVQWEKPEAFNAAAQTLRRHAVQEALAKTLSVEKQ